jgi:uncharacterized protein (TIGR00369 family)
MNSNAPSRPVPADFVAAPIGGVFATNNGPIYARWHKGHILMGLRVDKRHLNPGNNCHGGMLATFTDILLSTAAQYQTDIPRQFLPTISLQMDFMAGAPLGSWVEGKTQILRVTKNLIFSQALVTADGELAVRASGVFRRGPLLPESDSDTWLNLPGMPVRTGH